MIPERIPIQRMEDYHTHFLGKTENGRQFFGYETFVFPQGAPAADWQNHRKEYVVLYIFDNEGNHINTNHWCAGVTSQADPSTMRTKLDEMIAELGRFEFSDIEVKPFQTVIDGVVFGLVPDEEHETVELEPSSTISFQEPWDGEYYT
jgi:formate hydrogenlyase regulatory protein HycA